MPRTKHVAANVTENTKDPHERGLEYLGEWWAATQGLRSNIKRANECVDGNIWSKADRSKTERGGQPALSFNELTPQVDLLSGIQRNMQLEYIAKPIGQFDRRLAEVATAALVAAQEYTRTSVYDDEVWDSGIIAGMGVWKLIHTTDDAEDIAWGDDKLFRINPLSFVFDPWYREPGMQDGRYMGDLQWMSRDEFESAFPGHDFPNDSHDWVTSIARALGTTEELGTAQSLADELFDQDTKRVRVAFLWEKVWKDLHFPVNTESGQFGDPAMSRKKAEEDIAEQIQQEVEDRFGEIEFEITPQGVVVMQDGTPSNVFPAFSSIDEANEVIRETKKQLRASLRKDFKIVSRRGRVLRRLFMTGHDVIDTTIEEFDDRKFPYAVYISRKYTDELESIQGIVLQNIDGLEEISKRYSNLLAHLNSSARSGFYNRKNLGADSRKLASSAGRSGVVVEYVTTKPEPIIPPPLDPGHFTLIQENIKGLQRRTGINAELLGLSTQATVSGRAINARQEGGLTANRPRIRSYEEAKLDLGRLQLSRIQQFWPVEKIRRVMDILEAQDQLGTDSVFTHPETGEPLTDVQIVELLTQFKTTRFDLALKLRPRSDTERAAQWEQAIQLAGLVTSTGRPLGPATMMALTEMADIGSSKLINALKIDITQPVDPAILQPGGANAQLNHTIQSINAGRGGASPEQQAQSA